MLRVPNNLSAAFSMRSINFFLRIKIKLKIFVRTKKLFNFPGKGPSEKAVCGSSIPSKHIGRGGGGGGKCLWYKDLAVLFQDRAVLRRREQ
jgi:hypothetical protein